MATGGPCAPQGNLQRPASDSISQYQLSPVDDEEDVDTGLLGRSALGVARIHQRSLPPRLRTRHPCVPVLR